MKIFMDWTVGWSHDSYSEPDRWVTAEVPGAVQLDWAKAENWDDHTYGDNWKQYRWMEGVYWTYRTVLKPIADSEDERIYFISKGIDYSFRILLNRKEILKQEGMFTQIELDLTEQIRYGGILEIIIDPTPKRLGADPDTRSEADHSFKPTVSYGWDWHPRLIPLGIWEETYLITRSHTHIVEADALYKLNDALDSVEVTLHVRLNQTVPGELKWRLIDPQGKVCFEQTAMVNAKMLQMINFLKQPELWWPHDHGEQPLYRSELYFQTEDSDHYSDIHVQKIGFRRVKLVMHDGAWKEPVDFPKGRSNPPITLEINGRRIFCKGTNWVQPDIFPGRLKKAHYESLLELAKAANMNMLRSWGGCIVNKQSFFERCDEIGMMVWQEFPLSCNQYPDTAAYLKVLDQESRSIICRLRQHASVVLWCGGNELFNSWSGMTEQSIALRQLNANCLELDPRTPFIMTAPLEGMAHGNYVFRYETGEDVLQVMPKASNTAYTEFGVPSPASVDKLKEFIPAEELFPPRPGTTWETHHAFNAWVGSTHLMPELIEDYFGPSSTLEQLVERGQFLQSEGYKCIFEEARRQKPKCSMALNWCFNEPWPAAANNSIISWPNQPKPAYYAVKASCRPILASSRLPKFSWVEGELFEPELWMLNDSPNQVPGGHMDVFLFLGSDAENHLLSWEFEAVQPHENKMGPTARFLLPKDVGARMTLQLRVREHPEWNSEYTLLCRTPSEKSKQNVLNM